jgi:hydroxyethylthiazole kinase
MLLALGASPIMAHAKQELADIVKIANSLVINIGTLDETWIAAIDLAQQAALQKKIPIVFDPVGAGASHYRTQTSKNILQSGINILRGNPSEIMSLVDDDIKTKGVDANHQSNDAINAAKKLAEKYQITVVISGQTDIIIDQNRHECISFGTPLFTKVTGMGCSATALIAAFAAINPDYFLAATHAMTTLTLAGEIAAINCKGPASFYNNLIDALYSLQKEDLIRDFF